MKREHAYTGCVNDAGRGWVGYCKCGWRTPPANWKQDAQLVLSQHIRWSGAAVASSDCAGLRPPVPGVVARPPERPGFPTRTSPHPSVVPDVKVPPVMSGSPSRTTRRTAS